MKMLDLHLNVLLVISLVFLLTFGVVLVVSFSLVLLVIFGFFIALNLLVNHKLKEESYQ